MDPSNELISIIMPSYNSGKWIKETIASVQAQTYKKWELIITDDASNDNTVDVVKGMLDKDPRIKLYVLPVNSGAAKARNNSLAYTSGRYIAYLDADDLWVSDKLEHQLKFMHDKGVAMCYTDYDIVNEFGEYRKTITVPKKVTYDSYLKKPLTCSHSVVFDTKLVDRSLLVMPDVRRGQDAATWLQVLKTGITGYALSESLAKYRRHSSSLSSNKLKAIKRTWYLYREIEHLTLPYACECFVSYAFNAIKKYI